MWRSDAPNWIRNTGSVTPDWWPWVALAAALIVFIVIWLRVGRTAYDSLSAHVSGRLFAVALAGLIGIKFGLLNFPVFRGNSMAVYVLGLDIYMFCWAILMAQRTSRGGMGPPPIPVRGIVWCLAIAQFAGAILIPTVLRRAVDATDSLALVYPLALFVLSLVLRLSGCRILFGAYAFPASTQGVMTAPLGR